MTERQLLFLRFVEIEGELEAIAEGRAVDLNLVHKGSLLLSREMLRVPDASRLYTKWIDFSASSPAG